LTAALALQVMTPEKYALIISGDTSYERHRINIETAYKTFLKNGFEKIYILDTDGMKSTGYPISGAADRETIEDVVNKLKQEMNSNDFFFLYVTDHGDRIEQEVAGEKISYSTILLNNDKEIGEEEFALMLNPLKPKQAVYLFDQCHSGGFADYFGYGNILAIASVDAEKVSYSHDKDSVGYFFMKALQGDGVADSDENGKISIKEAFDYMMRRYTYSIKGDQKPFINSQLNPNDVYIDE